MAVEIIPLLTVWIPSYNIAHKLILTVVLLIKFIIDYDVARPGHNGNIFKLMKNLTFETGNIVVVCIQFMSALVFLILSSILKAWLPTICGVLAAVIYILKIAYEIKETIIGGKRRRKRNTNTNYNETM